MKVSKENSWILCRIKLKRSGSLELETCAGNNNANVTFTDNDSSSAYKQNPWAMQCQKRHFTKMQRKQGENQRKF